jgi:hypothetical protein
VVRPAFAGVFDKNWSFYVVFGGVVVVDRVVNVVNVVFRQSTFGAQKDTLQFPIFSHFGK